ncbi:receptor tyrosine-protein kinase erbB-4-like isoform X2 [Styela clava]
MNLKINILVLILLLFVSRNSGVQGKAVRCLGTNSAFSIAEDRLDHLNKLVIRYTNCTIVQGNLEISGLENPNIDASFLKDIEVVTGYVLIAINYLPYIPLEKLKIIRGQELHGPNKLALNVVFNYDKYQPNLGLRQIGFKSLTEIQRGNVSIVQNTKMCFLDTINWSDIMNPAAKKRDGWRVTINNTVDHIAVKCPKCHESCNGRCWGEGADMCQTLTSTICHENCGDARCRGPGRDDCCDRECACGCTGSTDSDCIACLHMNNSGVCQQSCPPQFIYDQQTSRHVPNPNFKYHFNEYCVNKCPDNMLVEENGCVKHCRKGRHNNGLGVCVTCTSNECNKECFGVGNPDGPLNKSETVDSKNVHFFEGCNIVRGNVIFQAYAFTGDTHTDTPPMTAKQILKAFSAVKVINGYLKILSWPEELEDFGVFSELTTIMGIDLFREVASLLIQDSITDHGPFHLSQVKRLGFKSLTSINYGNVYIGYMKQLCYQDKVNWTTIIKSPVIHRSFENGLLLRANGANCENETCNAACSVNGCWGPGADECLGCRNLTYNDECRTECDKSLGIYRDGDTCKACDAQCKDTCVGAGPSNCTACKHLSYGSICVPMCPPTMYGDPITKKCMTCNSTCFGQKDPDGTPMCSGPNSTLGPGGCQYCSMVMADRDLTIHECLPSYETECPEAHFVFKNGLKGTEQACVPCVKHCTNCTGASETDCLHPLPVKSDTAIVMAVVVTIVALGLVCLIGFLFHHRRQKIRRKRQMSMRALGLEGGAPEPMTPSGVAPNQAQLRIVKETELRIGKILGSGAFGTVHNGYWIPDLAPREKVRVPVAIKVLRDESSQVASNEILDEAFVMASCEHPNLVRLLGISLSQQIMLISQLMPLGNLLEYVRDNKDNIGSQTLLNWCLQIAKGMCYLAEEKHLVHRDLAARNVLVKSPNHVRITDFGLAKLLDVNEDVYRAEGGKMPIKWLALESIQHRLFTQKSDVWSFGVTVWELMTFGKKPYENVPAREVHTLLERGERLVQPATCTIDVYMLMIKCWTVDPDSRPTFRELVEDFGKMARDPSRYLVIANDGSLPALPSPTTSEFFRSLKHEEGDDFPLQDAEEYLHPDNFDSATANGGHFPLQPAPVTAQWRKQHADPRHFGLSGRFAASQSSSAADSRLDSAVTVLTSLPSESAYPNGCSTPFGMHTPGINMTPRSTREGNGFPAFGRSSNRMSRDQVPGTSGMNSLHPLTIGPRTQSDSSDVFLNTPSAQPKDNPWEIANGHDHHVNPRAREDSATTRYCMEPILARQESRPNDYLEPISFPSTSSGATSQSPVFHRVNNGSIARSGKNPLTAKLSLGMENPEYEPTFTPSTARVGNGFYSGMHNLLGARSSIPVTDDDGYEVPMAGGQKPNNHYPITVDSRRLSTEYENIDISTGMPDVSRELEEDEHGYLAVNKTSLLPRRRDSHSGESTSSEKRDSGMQSEGDEEVPLKPGAKNGKAAGDVGANVTNEGKNRGQVAAPFHPESSGTAADYFSNNATPERGFNFNKPKANPHHSVDNPNYELLENMTNGGFEPMSEFKPMVSRTNSQDPWSTNNNPFPDFLDDSVTSKRNPMDINLNCDGLDDNIFVTPESRRRGTANVKALVGGGEDFDDIFITPETKRRNISNGEMPQDPDGMLGKSVPRTYSEPDSGVGIEMGIDNALYHRLGSSGWDASD